MVARGGFDGTLEDAAGWPAGYRHGESLLPAIERLLAPAGGRTAIGAVVVGTGPGAFTGLRVGIATAKGLAHGLGCPIVGVPTGLALLAAVPGPCALLLPAGPADRVLVRAGEPSRLLPGGTEPELRSGERLVAVDLDGRAPEDALERGRVAHDGLAAALLRLGAERLAAETPRGRPRGARPRLRDAAAGRDRDDRGGGMVARPPVKLTIAAMQIADLDVVQAIERASFSSPWPPNAYRSELETNRLANYLVARVDGEIVGYGGMWLMVDEAHITTFAVHPAWRRQRIGERLLLAFLDLAVAAPGPRGDARGPPVEPGGAASVREVRVPARRPAAALLQRRQRGRADHDHRAARRAADA